jgi:hypothetical protein
VVPRGTSLFLYHNKFDVYRTCDLNSYDGWRGQLREPVYCWNLIHYNKSLGNQLLGINSSAERSDPKELSGRVLDGKYDRSILDKFNKNRRLSKLVQKNGGHFVQISIEY